MAAFSSAIVCVLVLVGASCAAVIADADSPSPASQTSGAGVRTFSRQMESSIDDLMNALAQVTKSKDELRCYCNLPVCVTTGYMCKSAMGTCFTEIVDRNDLSKSRHGCLELLSSDKPAEACHHRNSHQNKQQQEKHPHHHPQRPLVLCCQDDLCNYGSQHVQLRLYAAHPHGNGAAGRNDSQLATGVETRSPAVETRLLNGADGASTSGNVGHDLWLKAATIAVPIAGGCILVLLVLLAMRMLRRDRENNNITVLGSGGYSLPAHRNDFQIRSVWGKARQQQQQQHAFQHANPAHQLPAQWAKDRQPMLPNGAASAQRMYAQYYQQHRTQHPHQCAPLLSAPHNVVYMPTVQKIVPPKRMWNKSCILAKNQPGVHNV